MVASDRASGVEDDRDRTVVDELHVHPRSEDARLDVDAELAQRRAEVLVQRLRHIGTCGRAEGRAVALRRVGNERELADDEGRAAGVDE